MKKVILYLCSFIFSFSSIIYAGEFPKILSYDTRETGFYLLEISPYFSPFYPDKLETQIQYGTKINYHFNPYYSFGINFSYAPLSYDANSDIADVITSDSQYIYDGYFMYSIPASFALTKNSYVECDLLAFGGMGLQSIGGPNYLTLTLGGGMKIYTSLKWLAVRIDIKDYFYRVKFDDDKKILDDFTTNIGLSFLFL